MLNIFSWTYWLFKYFFMKCLLNSTAHFLFFNYFYFFHYSWFTVFWPFLLYGKVTQSYIYIYIYCTYIIYVHTHTIHTHIYIHAHIYIIFSYIILHHVPSQVIRYSSPCYTTGSHCLSEHFQRYSMKPLSP